MEENAVANKIIWAKNESIEKGQKDQNGGNEKGLKNGERNKKQQF